MSVLPDLENELHRAAARPRRRLLPATRGGVFVLTGFVIAGGVAGAAGLALVGPEPKAFENFDQDIPVAITGKPVSSGTLLPIRTADPDGGPPWGIRVTRTSRGASCIQVGRVVQDQLVVLGRDNAFNNDGRAHIKPPGRDICVPTATDGTPILKSRPGNPTSSGLGVCQPRLSREDYDRRERAGIERTNQLKGFPGRRRQFKPASDALWARVKADLCPKGAQRAIRWGFLGQDATEATYRAPGSPATTQNLPNDGFGAYLFVRRIADGERATFNAMRRPGKVYARFSEHRLLAITGPGHVRDLPGLTLPATDSRRGPVNATFQFPQRPTDPVRVTFQAPVDALRYPTTFKAYAEIRPSNDPAAEKCRNATTTKPEKPAEPVAPSMRKGQRATLTVPPPDRFKGKPAAWCPGPYRLRLIQIGGAKKGYIDLVSHTFTVR